MALRSLQVERFRAFGHRAVLELAPMTLVFGYNSQGKSALIRALPLLAASVRPDSSDALEVRSPAARGATFEELMSRFGTSPSVNFGLTWDDEDHAVVRVEIALRSGGIGQPQIIERLSGRDANDGLVLELVAALRDEPGDTTVYLATSGEEQCEASLSFRGLVPTLISTGGAPTNTLGARLDLLRQRLQSLEPTIHWLAAVRKLPERRGELRGRPPRIGHDGEHADEHLAFALSRDRALLDVVNDFYRQVTDHELWVEESRAGDTAGYVLRLSHSDRREHRVNLLDTGEGMAQILPVAVLCGQAILGQLGPSPVVILEHPEIHLHPRAHGRMAAWFCDAASKSSARFVVETHSENFLSRVQLAVVKSDLDAERVRLNWIDWRDDGASVRPVAIDSLAVLEGWPAGVFAEDTALHREILSARRVRTQGSDAGPHRG
jgi:predicted ATPase